MSFADLMSAANDYNQQTAQSQSKAPSSPGLLQRIIGGAIQPITNVFENPIKAGAALATGNRQAFENAAEAQGKIGYRGTLLSGAQLPLYLINPASGAAFDAAKASGIAAKAAGDELAEQAATKAALNIAAKRGAVQSAAFGGLSTAAQPSATPGDILKGAAISGVTGGALTKGVGLLGNYVAKGLAAKAAPKVMSGGKEVKPINVQDNVATAQNVATTPPQFNPALASDTKGTIQVNPGEAPKPQTSTLPEGWTMTKEGDFLSPDGRVATLGEEQLAHQQPELYKQLQGAVAHNDPQLVVNLHAQNTGNQSGIERFLQDNPNSLAAKRALETIKNGGGKVPPIPQVHQLRMQGNGYTGQNINKFGEPRVNKAVENLFNLGAEGSNINKILTYLQPAINDMENKINAKLASSTATYSVANLEKFFDEIAQKSVGTNLEGEAAQSVKNYVVIAKKALQNEANGSDTINAIQLNRVKQELGNHVNWAKISNPSAADTVASDVAHDLYTGINGTLKKTNPDIAQLLEQSSTHMDSEKMLANAGGQTAARVHATGIPISFHSQAINSLAEAAQDKALRMFDRGNGQPGLIGSTLGIPGKVIKGAAKAVGQTGTAVASQLPGPVNKAIGTTLEHATAPIGGATGEALAQPQPAQNPQEALAPPYQTAQTQIPSQGVLADSTEQPQTAENSLGIPSYKLAQAMMLDLQQTGGKNMTTLHTLYTIAKQEEDAQQAAYDKQNKPLTSGAASQVQSAKDAMNGLQAIQAAFNGTRNTGEGLFSKVLSKKPLGFSLPGSQGITDVNASIQQALPDIAKALGYGTSKAELSALLDQLPNTSDTQKSAQIKLSKISDRIQQYMHQFLATEANYVQPNNNLLDQLISNGIDTSQLEAAQ